MAYRGQSRGMSLTESVVGAILAYGQLYLFTVYVFPRFGATVPPHVAMNTLGIMVSLTSIRHYLVRRAFNAREVETHVTIED